MVEVKEDLTGVKFNHWTVLGRADDYINPNTGKRCARWLCECDCDDKTKKIVVGTSLKNNSSKSCGCHKKKVLSETKRKYNVYDLSADYGIGYTLNGEEFYFDLEDYDIIKDYYWYKDKQGYIVARIYDPVKSKRITMHRLIMGFPNVTDIDHIHGIKTRNDNRKGNLRVVTHSQNGMNKDLQSNNTSGVAGVGWYSKTNKWRAYIMIDRKFIHLGLFDSFEDAVKARKEAEEKYFGEFSYDNSINS